MKALVTGAGGAIGAGVVRQLVDQGFEVIAQDLREEALAAVAGAAVTTVAGDLLDAADRERLATAWGEGELDRVIAAHGVDGSAALSDLDPAFVRRVMEVNAGSVPPLLHLVLPALRRSGGTFVVVASQAGLQGEANNAAYCAAKFALVGWVTALAPGMAAEGVAIRALCPGCTKSPLLFAAQERFAAARGVPAAEFTAERMAAIPAGRFAEVEETAAAAVFLAERGARPVVFAPTGGEVLF